MHFPTKLTFVKFSILSEEVLKNGKVSLRAKKTNEKARDFFFDYFACLHHEKHLPTMAVGDFSHKSVTFKHPKIR